MLVEVDQELLPMKAHYFLFNAGTAPVVPFMPTLARQLGFSTFVVGNMYTILPFIGMLAKPMFGLIADRYHQHRQIFLLAEIVTAVAFFLIMFIPAIPQPRPTVQLHCRAGASDLIFCSKLDDCIEHDLTTHFTNQTIACKLRCQAEEYMWDIVCQDWLKQNDTDQCLNGFNMKPTGSDYLNLTTFVNMNEIYQAGNCLYFIIPKDRGQLNGENVTMNCPREKHYFNTSCDVSCDDPYLELELRNGRNEHDIRNSSVLGLYQFWLFFGLLIISWVGMAVVVSIGDAICFSILGERPCLYGKQRLFGSIGWGIFAIMAGVLVDKFSDGRVEKDYTIVFWMTAIIIGLDILASYHLKHTQTHLSPNILKDVGRMFGSTRCVVFFAWCISIGLCTALVWNLLFIYLEELGTKLEGCRNSMKTLQGLAMGIQSFGGELPFFFLSDWILQRIGHVNAMNLVLFGFGMRFILYSMLRNPWYVLPIELMNGITFGVFYSTMASYTSLVAPPGTEATMQGLVGAIFEGIGVSLGSFIGGALFDTVGGRHTFEIFGVAAFMAFVVHIFVQFFLQRKDLIGSGSASQNGKSAQINLGQSIALDDRSVNEQNIPVNNKTIGTRNDDNSR